jgi:glycosyltransferase involved in cell wall biosynthesis
MRVAFISTMGAAPWGGSEELWARTALVALEQQHEVFASVYHWNTVAAPLEQLRKRGAIIHSRRSYLPNVLVRVARRIQTVSGITKSLEAALISFKPDLICINQGGNLDLSQMKWLGDCIITSGIPFCVISHNYDPSYLPLDIERQIAKHVFKKATRLFFVSSEQTQVTQRQLACAFSNTEVIKNPVNIDVPELLPWPENRIPQFAIVAGLHIDRKGHDVALEVLSTEKWRRRSWQLNIYGDGPDHNYIKELVDYFGLGNRVVIHGNVENIVEVWRHNHLLLLPSRREAAPIVVMEAMLCGRPVVATAVGTIPEWVMPGKTGFVAPAATGPLFEVALEQAWISQPTWEEMGRQAYAWAYANADPFAADTFLNKLVQLLDTVA